jgi:hypothetical protein
MVSVAAASQAATAASARPGSRTAGIGYGAGQAPLHDRIVFYRIRLLSEQLSDDEIRCAYRSAGRAAGGMACSDHRSMV